MKPFLLFAILLLFLWIQMILGISPDVSYLVYAANQMLSGGHYVADIFETNPPMIFYLYFPACYLAKLLSIHFIKATSIYVLSLVLVSAAISYILLRPLFYAILLALFILPTIAFAQREHLLFIFMLPYLGMAAWRLDDKKINLFFALAVGFFAGLGIALKPYFLITPVLVELLFIIKKRSIFGWIRPETIMIISVLGLYAVSILLLQPEYIHVILPLLSKYYFAEIKQPWTILLVRPQVLFCFAAVITYLFYWRYDRHKNVGRVIFMALVGMIMAFIIPQNVWFYHVYPAFALALLLFTHIAEQEMKQMKNKERILVFIGLLIFPFQSCYVLCRDLLAYQKTHPTNQIVRILNHLPGKQTVNCFTARGTSSCFPMVFNLKNGEYQSRFPSFWWYYGLQTKGRDLDKNLLLGAVADDLNHYQSKWIIIDEKSFRRGDAISTLSENKVFREAWKSYAYYATVGDYTLYQRKELTIPAKAGIYL